MASCRDRPTAVRAGSRIQVVSFLRLDNSWTAGTSDPGMIGYTLPEIRRLLISLIQRYAPDPEAVWSWSRWRRRRQYQARLCHYRRRGYQLT